MSAAANDLDGFREAYRAFVIELIRLADLQPGARTPAWVGALAETPFTFPAQFEYEDAFAAALEQLRALDRAWGSNPACVAAAGDVIRGLFLGAPPPGATRGRPPSPPSPSGSGLLGVDENERVMREVPRMVMPSPQQPVANPPEQPQRAEPPSTPEPAEARYLNAGIQNHDRDEPLALDESYLIQFGVDLKKGGASGRDFSARVPDASVLFQDTEETVDLTIQLDGDDFDIAPRTRVLVLPRRGASLKKVSFAVTPKKEGRCTLTATVHKAGNFLFEMEMNYSVGATDAAPATTTVHGRPLTAAQNLAPRELGLRIKPVQNGYECTIWGSTSNQVTLPVTEAELGDIVASARAAMMNVVNQEDESQALIFQTGIDITATQSAVALKTLAFAGAELFRRLFFGPMAGPEVKAVGKFLKARAMAPGPGLKLQIVAEGFPIPWGLLYFGETAGGAALDWNSFLGLRHIIEQIPRQADMLVDDSVITSNAPSLAVSVTVNENIDKDMKRDFVAKQVQYWTDRGASSNGGMQLATRTTKAALLDALQAKAGDQVMYFYCHALTASAEHAGGIMSSCLVLTGKERVTLSDFYREAPTDDALPGHPLVFLNACESAELTPEFYDGFVPYFMAKGARGVVGTECKTPAVFGTEWALKFFPRFLAGEALGALFLDLRREFCLQHGNPMGLLYAVYCDGDTQVQPGLSS